VWERRILIRAREGAPRRARSKGGAEGGVPVASELMRLWSDYMHEEYRDLDCDFVFVNLWAGRVGRPLTYSNVDRIVERTRQKVGFGSRRTCCGTRMRRWRIAMGLGLR
jgi:integrase/recombinase XerD